MKLKLSSQQLSIFETIASNVNHKYYFFPKIYIKIEGTNEFEEVDLKSAPEGVQKYILTKLGNIK